MTVDFARLLAESRERREDDDYDLVITFEVTRGTFDIPARLLADDVTDEDDHELRVLFAKALPEHDPRAVLNTSRRFNRDGSATVTWRRIVTHTHRA